MINIKKFEAIQLLLLFGLAILSACTFEEPGAKPSDPPAILEGSVLFGPLTPVTQINRPTPETPPEMYKDRFVLVYDQTGENLIMQIAVGLDGYYRAEISPGVYTVTFSLIGIERAENIPAVISLAAGQVISLEISVDTGIR